MYSKNLTALAIHIIIYFPVLAQDTKTLPEIKVSGTKNVVVFQSSNQDFLILEGKKNETILLENVISNSKTSRQFSDFHYHRKHGCSSMIDFINKVSKEID